MLQRDALSPVFALGERLRGTKQVISLLFSPRGGTVCRIPVMRNVHSVNWGYYVLHNETPTRYARNGQIAWSELHLSKG